MKNTLLAIIVILYACQSFSQCLTAGHNSLRNGDILSVKEIPFLNIDKSGTGVIWDFSDNDFNTYGKTYKEYIYIDADSIYHYITPHADKRFLQKGDTLLCTGYSTNNIEVSHMLPDAERIFPVSYGDSMQSMFYGEGFYSQKLHFVGYGAVKRKIVAVGRLILPDADTLRNIVMLNESALLGQRLSSNGSIKANGDSARYEPDSVMYLLESDSVKWHVETWSLYAAGYRYPVLKSVRNSIVKHETEKTHFEQSYYYPRAEWELALPDEDNEEERLRSMSEEWFADSYVNTTPDYTIESVMRGGYLEVTIGSDEEIEVELIAATQQGYILARTPKEILTQGTAVRRLDVSSALPGIFIFTAIINGKSNSTKVTKQ